MNQFVLHNKNNSDVSIFENNNFYNISFNKNINGWLKFFFINNTINIYMSIDNVDGYILWKAYINEYNFININLICSETSGLFLKNNINYSKLLIIFPITITNLNDLENYLGNADFLYKINFNRKNIKEKIIKKIIQYET